MGRISINHIALIFGLFPILLGALSLHVRWVNPKSRFEPAFRARWRGGREASNFGAAAQIFAFLAVGIFMVGFGLLGFGRFVEYWQYVIYLAVAIFGLAFFLD